MDAASKALLNNFILGFHPGTSAICAQYLRLPKFATASGIFPNRLGPQFVVVGTGTTKFLLVSVSVSP
jgi:hypothetical protein